MRKKCRAVFISDIHLGSPYSQDKAACVFLKGYAPETLYLVGDIIDGWALKSNWHWPLSHTALIREILGHKQVIYLVGNHNEFLRSYVGNYGNLTLTERAIHEGADGKKYLVIHGDAYDLVIRNAKWLAHLGDWGYDMLLACNRWLSRILSRFGYQWSLSAWVKHNVKSVVNFLSSHHHAMIADARRAEALGVICGHLHHAEKKKIGDLLYLNCGDWVKSATAIIEEMDGTFKIIR